MGGFTDWVEQIADSKDALDYRKKVTDPESASMWQSLSFGAELQGGVLPERLPGWGGCHRPLSDQQGRASAGNRSSAHEKEETVYVIAGSDAEEHVARRFPHKKTKRVGNGLRPRTIQRFLSGLRSHVSAGEGGRT